MPLDNTIRQLIDNAWEDGYPCLVATTGADGPNISPKGSMVVFDDRHLAYWERSKKKAFENLSSDRRVVVMYSNFRAQRDQLIKSGFLRFWGVAHLQESGPVRDEIFAKLTKREQGHDGADTGIGVLVAIDRATDMFGRDLL